MVAWKIHPVTSWNGDGTHGHDCGIHGHDRGIHGHGHGIRGRGPRDGDGLSHGDGSGGDDQSGDRQTFSWRMKGVVVVQGHKSVALLERASLTGCGGGGGGLNLMMVGEVAA